MSPIPTTFAEYLASLNDPKFANLAVLNIDDRIELIGGYVMTTGNRSAVTIDDDRDGIASYTRNILRRFPGLRIARILRNGNRGTVVLEIERDKQHTAN